MFVVLIKNGDKTTALLMAAHGGHSMHSLDSFYQCVSIQYKLSLPKNLNRCSSNNPIVDIIAVILQPK